MHPWEFKQKFKGKAEKLELDAAREKLIFERQGGKEWKYCERERDKAWGYKSGRAMLEGARGGRFRVLWAGRCVVGCKNLSPAQPVVKPGTTAPCSHCPDPGWLLPVPRPMEQLGQAGSGAGCMHTCTVRVESILLASTALPPSPSPQPPIKKDPDNTIKMSCVDCRCIVL